MLVGLLSVLCIIMTDNLHSSEVDSNYYRVEVSLVTGRSPKRRVVRALLTISNGLKLFHNFWGRSFDNRD